MIANIFKYFKTHKFKSLYKDALYTARENTFQLELKGNDVKFAHRLPLIGSQFNPKGKSWGETVETVVNMIEFIYDKTKDKVLKSIDTNNDGIVTTDEVKNKCGCCGNNKLATCWSKFLINFICCGKNDESTYEKQIDNIEQKEGIEV